MHKRHRGRVAALVVAVAAVGLVITLFPAGSRHAHGQADDLVTVTGTLTAGGSTPPIAVTFNDAGFLRQDGTFSFQEIRGTEGISFSTADGDPHIVRFLPLILDADVHVDIDLPEIFELEVHAGLPCVYSEAIVAGCACDAAAGRFIVEINGGELTTTPATTGTWRSFGFADNGGAKANVFAGTEFTVSVQTENGYSVRAPWDGSNPMVVDLEREFIPVTVTVFGGDRPLAGVLFDVQGLFDAGLFESDSNGQFVVELPKGSRLQGEIFLRSATPDYPKFSIEALDLDIPEDNAVEIRLPEASLLDVRVQNARQPVPEALGEFKLHKRNSFRPFGDTFIHWNIDSETTNAQAELPILDLGQSFTIEAVNITDPSIHGSATWHDGDQLIIDIHPLSAGLSGGADSVSYDQEPTRRFITKTRPSVGRAQDCVETQPQRTPVPLGAPTLAESTTAAVDTIDAINEVSGSTEPSGTDMLGTRPLANTGSESRTAALLGTSLVAAGATLLGLGRLRRRNGQHGYS